MGTYEEAMATGAERYADALAALRLQGVNADFTQTGGMCAALEVRLEGGWTLLVTDAEDSLSWNREEHSGWGVGIYRPESEYDDGPVHFESSEDGAVATLIPLVRRVTGQMRR